MNAQENQRANKRKIRMSQSNQTREKNTHTTTLKRKTECEREFLKKKCIQNILLINIQFYCRAAEASKRITNKNNTNTNTNTHTITIEKRRTKDAKKALNEKRRFEVHE